MSAPETIQVLHKKTNRRFDVFPLEDNCLMYPYRLTPEGYSRDWQTDIYVVIDFKTKEMWDGQVQAVFPHEYLVELKENDEESSYHLVEGDFILVRVARTIENEGETPNVREG